MKSARPSDTRASSWLGACHDADQPTGRITSVASLCAATATGIGEKFDFEPKTRDISTDLVLRAPCAQFAPIAPQPAASSQQPDLAIGLRLSPVLLGRFSLHYPKKQKIGKIRKIGKKMGIVVLLLQRGPLLQQPPFLEHAFSFITITISCPSLTHSLFGLSDFDSKI